jgi:Family of unknown function (DUF6364)
MCGLVPIAELQHPVRIFVEQLLKLDIIYRNLYCWLMKTTLDINDSLLANAKALAAQQRTSLTRLIEEGLQLRLRSSHTETKVSKRKIPVFKGRGGVVAGLNPCNNRALLDAADNDA